MGEVDSWMPLPTRPQRYYDPASLVSSSLDKPSFHDSLIPSPNSHLIFSPYLIQFAAHLQFFINLNFSHSRVYYFLVNLASMFVVNDNIGTQTVENDEGMVGSVT